MSNPELTQTASEQAAEMMPRPDSVVMLLQLFAWGMRSLCYEWIPMENAVMYLGEVER